MAYSSSSSNANSKVHTCSTECEQSYAQLKKLYDTQREQLGDASIEIQAYTQALKKVEAQLVAHQKNQLWYEEKIRFMKIDLDDKTDVLTYHKKLLAEAVKEKEELKTKLESFETSSKSLNTLLNSQLSANDKAGFGHNGAKESKVSETITSVSKVKTNDEIVVKPKEVTKTVKPSFEKIESVNARNETVRQAENPRKNNKSPRGNKRNWNGMMTQKLGENFEFNNKACYVCGSFDHLHYTCKHKRKINDQKQVKPVWNNSKRVNHQNFGRFSHPNPKSNIVSQAVLTKSGLVSLNTAKSVSTAQPKKTMNGAMPTTYSYYKAYSSAKIPFNKKTSNHNRYFNKRVNTVKKAEVNTVKALASWVWKPKHEELDHVVNTARQNLSSQAATTSTARKVNTARPIVNEIRPRNNFYKSHSPIRMPFNRTIAPKAKFSNHKVNTAEVKAVSVIGGIWETTVKSSAGFKNRDIIEFCGSKGIKRPVRLENQANKTAGPEKANHSAGTQDNIDAGNSKIETDHTQDYFVLPIYSSYTLTDKSSKVKNEGLKDKKRRLNDAAEVLRKEFAQSTEDLLLQVGAARAFQVLQWPDFIILESTVNVSPIPTSRIHSIHPTTEILGDPKSAVETRSKVNKISGAH
ncbi:hypothetical protein Tco_1042313 [Tanacetum coccineum]|uniref:Uncharacterized protein n=1 Tax=Tanacetum coccineum TaxID=301880 RepID=A0ABQ5GJD9_9ASTR